MGVQVILAAAKYAYGSRKANKAEKKAREEAWEALKVAQKRIEKEAFDFRKTPAGKRAYIESIPEERTKWLQQIDERLKNYSDYSIPLTVEYMIETNRPSARDQLNKGKIFNQRLKKYLPENKARFEAEKDARVIAIRDTDHIRRKLAAIDKNDLRAFEKIYLDISKMVSQIRLKTKGLPLDIDDQLNKERELFGLINQWNAQWEREYKAAATKKRNAIAGAYNAIYAMWTNGMTGAQKAQWQNKFDLFNSMGKGLSAEQQKRINTFNLSIINELPYLTVNERLKRIDDLVTRIKIIKEGNFYTPPIVKDPVQLKTQIQQQVAEQVSRQSKTNITPLLIGALALNFLV